MKTSRLVMVLGLIAVAAAARLLPHPPNFAPVAAIALFAGAYVTDRWLAFAVPFAALFATDLVLGLHSTMAFVYAGFAVTVVLGMALARRRTPLRIAGAAVASSLMFFLVTNFGTWLVQDLYPATAAGLAACYAAALPFLQNSLAGDLFYTALLFGAMRVLEQRFVARRAAALRAA